MAMRRQGPQSCMLRSQDRLQQAPEKPKGPSVQGVCFKTKMRMLQMQMQSSQRAAGASFLRQSQ